MANLSEEDVKRVANLAKLKLTKKEHLKFTKELTSIVDYISQLNEVDTSKTEPTSQTTGLTSVKRADEVKQDVCLTQEQVLSGTEKTSSGYFIVPGILVERSDK